MKKALLTLLLVLGMTLFTLSAVEAREIYRMPHDRGIIQLEIIGDSYGSFPIGSYGRSHWGDTSGGTGVIAVSKGERFRLRITNLTDRRLGLVIAIDGRNILSGKESWGRPKDGLYVLNPHAAGNFTGWRTSTKEVRRFYFTDAEDSYAAGRGSTSRVGQIEVIAYAEYQPYPMPEPSLAGDRLKPSVHANMIRREEKKEQGPGTGWGERDYSPVRMTQFQAESSPLASYLVHYQWARRRSWNTHGGHEPHGFAPPPTHRHGN